MNLAATQASLWKLITHADSALERVAPRLIRSTPEFPAPQRVTVFADMYFWRNVDALQGDFPKLRELLSDDSFWSLTRRYLAAHPSQHHDLGRAGWKLSVFLKRRAPPRARRDLAALATLEWARSEAYVALDSSVCTMTELGAIAPARFGAMRLHLTPSVRLVSAGHDVGSVWSAIEHKRPIPKPRRGRHHFVVWRKGFEVFHAEIDAKEAAALGLALKRARLAQVVAPFGTSQAAATAAFAAIGSWVREEMVARVSATRR